MATIVQVFPAAAAELRSTGFPGISRVDGTTIPVVGYAFDAAATETIFFRTRAVAYGSGNLTIGIDWYADTASSGVVRWSAAIAAITPDADTQDVETDGLATATTFDDTHLATTGQRLHRAVITVTNLDSIAAEDNLVLSIARIGGNAADTMAGDAIVVTVSLSYSDT